METRKYKGKWELTMSEYESLTSIDESIDYNITDYPFGSITNAQMNYVLTTKRLFNQSAIFTCLDDGTYTQGHTYQLEINGDTKSWKDLTPKSTEVTVDGQVVESINMDNYALSSSVDMLRTDVSGNATSINNILRRIYGTGRVGYKTTTTDPVSGQLVTVSRYGPSTTSSITEQAENAIVLWKNTTNSKNYIVIGQCTNSTPGQISTFPIQIRQIFPIGNTITINDIATDVSFTSDPQTQIDGKLDANTTSSPVLSVGRTAKVYARTDTDNLQVVYTVGKDVKYNGIPMRDGNGQITLPITPTEDKHAASKKYVDDLVASMGGGSGDYEIVDVSDLTDPIIIDCRETTTSSISSECAQRLLAVVKNSKIPILKQTPYIKITMPNTTEQSYQCLPFEVVRNDELLVMLRTFITNTGTGEIWTALIGIMPDGSQSMIQALPSSVNSSGGSTNYIELTTNFPITFTNQQLNITLNDEDKEKIFNANKDSSLRDCTLGISTPNGIILLRSIMGSKTSDTQGAYAFTNCLNPQGNNIIVFLVQFTISSSETISVNYLCTDIPYISPDAIPKAKEIKFIDESTLELSSDSMDFKTMPEELATYFLSKNVHTIQDVILNISSDENSDWVLLQCNQVNGDDTYIDATFINIGRYDQYRTFGISIDKEENTVQYVWVNDMVATQNYVDDAISKIDNSGTLVVDLPQAFTISTATGSDGETIQFTETVQNMLTPLFNDGKINTAMIKIHLAELGDGYAICSPSFTQDSTTCGFFTLVNAGGGSFMYLDLTLTPASARLLVTQK